MEPGLIQYPVRPKQNRIERRAQFVTKGSEKTILGGTGRFGILFCPLQFLLDPSTLNKKPNLTAKRGDELEQIGIRLSHMFAEQFNDTIDRATGEKGKSETAVQSRFPRCRCPGKILVYDHIVNPGGLV